MRHPLAPRAVLLTGLGVLAAVGTGCMAAPSEPAASSAPASSTGVPAPDVAGYAPLTVHLVVPADAAPEGASGRAIGCGDLLIPVETSPADAPDRAAYALDFLLSDGRGSHGDPPLYNELVETGSTLVSTGHRREGDTEVFTFSGTLSTEGECSAARVRAQLQETARAQTDAAHVRLEVDGRDLDELLGLAPLALGP